MAKSILKMLIRVLTIAALLYGSYNLYTFYTYKAIQMIDFEKVRISFIAHSTIFFLIGMALKFDGRLISGIKKRTVKVNAVKLGMSIVSLIVLVLLRYNIFMYISCFIALFSGFFLIESMEYKSHKKEPAVSAVGSK